MFNYYIYFDRDTGEIDSITNEKLDTEFSVKEVTFAEVEHFLSGTSNFFKYKISLKNELQLVEKVNFLSRLSKIPTAISASNNNNLDFTIVKHAGQLIFSVADTFKEELAGIDSSYSFTFYVVSGKNLHYMKHKIDIPVVELLNGDVIKKLDTFDIVILTHKFFKSYGMKVVDD